MRSRTLILSVLCLAPLLVIAPSAKASLGEPIEAVPTGGKVLDVDIDVGNRGFVVIGWTERPKGASDDSLPVAYVRVKQPGEKKPRRAVRLGVASGAVNVEIGSGDLAVITWSGSDGHIRYRQRRPRSSWSPVEVIGDRQIFYANTAVGPDGTVIATTRVGSLEVPETLGVLVSVKNPGSPEFSAWREVSGNANVGVDLDVVAGKDGQGTVAWSGLCPPGAGDPAYYVDIDDQTQTEPIELKNSNCTVWDLELARDGAGRQYLKIGTWTGLRLAVRNPDEPFPRMRSVTNSFKRANGDLAVSRNGHMALVWATAKVYPTSYRYLTMNKGTNPTKVRTLLGPRMNVKRTRDVRLDSSMLPSGKLFTLWNRLGPPDSDLRYSQTMGTSSWLPGTKYKRPAYTFPISRCITPYPALVDTADDGSRLAWWIEENDRGEIKNVPFSAHAAERSN